MGEIESVLNENRVFEPPGDFSKSARVKNKAEYEALYRRAAENPAEFWSEIANQLHWFEPWTDTRQWSPPDAKWFVGGKTNISYNCLDRHLRGQRANKAALIWEGEPGDTRTYTYRQLHREVCRFANGLSSLGVKKGDRVSIYMPLIPETVIAMQACARLGATHSVVFGGFSAEALAERNRDAEAKVLITADGGYRRGAVVPLKDNADQAVANSPTVEKVVVVKRCGNDIAWHKDRDIWFHDLVADQANHHEAVPVDAEHPLFILYTSGTTGKPKGIYHSTGGYMVGTYYTAQMVFDLRDEDVFWCTADVGWVTGHSYLVYGPLANGATCVMYEGAPDFPDHARFWRMIEEHRVSVFYTAPTAIRAFMRWGDEHPQSRDLSSLRLLGTVGEPINPEAWVWYHEVIGAKRCPIVDTWWQTETGGIMLSPLPGAIATKPGSCCKPLPGVVADVVDEHGAPCGANKGGLLVIREPWPHMLRGIWGDHERFAQTYFGKFDNLYFAGDGARKDEDGYFWVMGRVDDVINVAGHRLSTMEVESALVSHPSVTEAAVVGRPDELKGQAIVAFVTPAANVDEDVDLARILREHVVKEIGALARPSDIRFAPSLPKTRSGKIMRRLLRDIAAGKVTGGDTTTLEDNNVLERLAASRNHEE